MYSGLTTLPLIRPIPAVEMDGDFFYSSNTIEHEALDNRTMFLIVRDVTLFTESIYL